MDPVVIAEHYDEWRVQSFPVKNQNVTISVIGNDKVTIMDATVMRNSSSTMKATTAHPTNITNDKVMKTTDGRLNNEYLED